MLLDANALLMPFQFRLNLEAELRRLLGDVDIAVPTPVLEEVRLLATHDRAAKAAERLAAKYRPVEGHGSADDALLELAGGEVHVLLRAAEERDPLERLDVVGFHEPGEARGPLMPFPRAPRVPRARGGYGSAGRSSARPPS